MIITITIHTAHFTSLPVVFCIYLQHNHRHSGKFGLRKFFEKISRGIPLFGMASDP